MTEQIEIRQAAIKHHDRLSATFDGYYRDLKSSRFTNEFTYGRHKIDVMIDALFAAYPKGSDVLDVGCGTGEHLARAQRHGHHATGIEPAPGMLEIAKNNAPEARVVSSVATEIPFGPSQFDIVIAIEVLRYLHNEDIHKALAEARRVLRPSGSIFVTLVNRWSLDGFYIRQRLRQRKKRMAFDIENPHCQFFTPGEARRALEQAGFTDVSIQGRLFAPFRPLWKLHPALARKLASRFETLDDNLHRWRWTRAFSGHLIATGSVPA